MRRVFPLLTLALLAASCGRPTPRVSLADTESAAPSRPAKTPLRIAIAPIESPEQSFAQYAELFDRVGHALGRPVELLQRDTYADVVELVADRHADAALVCSGPYVEARRSFGAQILAVPRMAGSDSYRAYIVVRRGEGLRRLEDLRGRPFALTDPLSTSGRFYPGDLLRREGQTPGSFFSRVIYTRGHDNSVHAVAEGVVDGAAVAGFVFDDLARRQPELTRGLAVIARSAPLGNPPLIVRADMDRELRGRLQEVLLRLHEDPSGRHLLTAMGIDRFVPGDPASYREVERLRASAVERERS